MTGFNLLDVSCSTVQSSIKNEIDFIRQSCDGETQKNKFDLMVSYFYSVYFGPKPRFPHSNWDYYTRIKETPLFNITTNSIEALNRALKRAIPSGFLKWAKVGKIMRDFHLRKMNEVYYEQYICDRLKLQKCITRKRAQEYRSLILEFDELNKSERAIHTVSYAYKLANVTKTNFSEKFLSEPPVDHDDVIKENSELLDFSEIFETEKTQCNLTFIPSFIIPEDLPDLENC